MTVKNKIAVRIAGKEYTLMGVESEAYLQKVALYIDKKMNEIIRVNSKLSTSMAAVLTAINVADDFFKSYENEFNLKKDLKRANDELTRLREQNQRLAAENSLLNDKSNSYQMELTKREAELNEVRNLLDKATRPEV